MNVFHKKHKLVDSDTNFSVYPRHFKCFPFANRRCIWRSNQLFPLVFNRFVCLRTLITNKSVRPWEKAPHWPGTAFLPALVTEYWLQQKRGFWAERLTPVTAIWSRIRLDARGCLRVIAFSKPPWPLGLDGLKLSLLMRFYCRGGMNGNLFWTHFQERGYLKGIIKINVHFGACITIFYLLYMLSLVSALIWFHGIP